MPRGARSPGDRGGADGQTGRRGGRRVARQSVSRPAFQADAIVQIERAVHPVDLGAILVPSDWLLLADGQTGTVAVAAICRAGDVADARVTAWFESAPAAKTEVEAVLTRDRRADVRLPLPPVPASAERDVLHMSITNTRGEQLWRKAIRAMLAHDPPKWPAFGATEAKLRYDAPISVARTTARIRRWTMPARGIRDSVT